MAYEEQQHKRSRVVVDTPAARREVVETRTAYVPERRGWSGGAVAALVVGAVALVTILFLFLMSTREDPTAANLSVATTAPTPLLQQQPPIIVQQPAPVQQPPVIVQPPATTTTQPAPIIMTPPVTSSGSSSSATTASGTDDASVQASIDKKLSDDPALASLGVVATVAGGKVTITGTVDSADVKARVERLVRAVKGVRTVDNQITVSGATSPTSPE